PRCFTTARQWRLLISRNTKSGRRQSGPRHSPRSPAWSCAGRPCLASARSPMRSATRSRARLRPNPGPSPGRRAPETS
ncbi:hypothetical protein H4R19_005910, partial [Coemansia spiralis]